MSQVMALLDGVAERLAGADPRLVALALALHVVNHVLRSAAWHGVLSAAYPDRDVPFLRVRCIERLPLVLS